MTSPMPPTSNMRASLRRAKAGGERFLGGMMAGATARRLQVKAFADEWAAANIVARHAVGPLWVVLGDSTSQGIGATTREAGYVGDVHEVLRRRDAWRVINLSRAGVGVADVLARQLPELAELTAEEPAALVTCIVGAEDVARRLPGTDIALRTMCAAMPRGAVIGVPDERWGEVPKAVVVAAPGQTVDPDALLAHCRASLAGFKCPKSVDVLAELPRNPTGKVLKKDLRERYRSSQSV